MILITDASRDYVLTSRGSRAMPFDRAADRQRTHSRSAVMRAESKPELELESESQESRPASHTASVGSMGSLESDAILEMSQREEATLSPIPASPNGTLSLDDVAHAGHLTPA